MFYDAFALNNLKCKAARVGKDVFPHVTEWVVTAFRSSCDMRALHSLMKVLLSDFYSQNSPR